MVTGWGNRKASWWRWHLPWFPRTHFSSLRGDLESSDQGVHEDRGSGTGVGFRRTDVRAVGAMGQRGRTRVKESPSLLSMSINGRASILKCF